MSSRRFLEVFREADQEEHLYVPGDVGDSYAHTSLSLSLSLSLPFFLSLHIYIYVLSGRGPPVGKPLLGVWVLPQNN